MAAVDAKVVVRCVITTYAAWRMRSVFGEALHTARRSGRRELVSTNLGEWSRLNA